MVPPDSDGIPPVPPYSGLPARVGNVSPKGLSPATAGLSRPFDYDPIRHLRALLPRHRLDGTGLGCSAFAHHYSRNHCCFLFLRLLRCFSSAGSPPDTAGRRAFSTPGCPIRKSADHRPFAPTRGLSQLVTSFIAYRSLGIHRAPLVTSRDPNDSFNTSRYCIFDARARVIRETPVTGFRYTFSCLLSTCQRTPPPHIRQRRTGEPRGE